MVIEILHTSSVKGIVSNITGNVLACYMLCELQSRFCFSTFLFCCLTALFEACFFVSYFVLLYCIKAFPQTFQFEMGTLLIYEDHSQ